MKKWEIGIDEAGRGPLAGPVAVGVALVAHDFDWELLPGVTDSKQLSEKNREVIFLKAKKLKKEGKLDYAVSMVSAPVIDRVGINAAVSVGMTRALKRLLVSKSPEGNPRERSLGLPSGGSHYTSVNRSIVTILEPEAVCIKLDGGLKAPARFLQQETIIKGDQKEKVIGLASIMAKVTRDRYMVRKAAAPLFAPYNFHLHKGYGTKNHRHMIAEHGFSELHRQTYCKNIKML